MQYWSSAFTKTNLILQRDLQGLEQNNLGEAWYTRLPIFLFSKSIFPDRMWVYGSLDSHQEMFIFWSFLDWFSKLYKM